MGQMRQILLLLYVLELVPRIPGFFPIIFRRPRLGFQQIEIDRRIPVKGKVPNGGKRVVNRSVTHLLTIEGVGGGKIVGAAIHPVAQTLE